MLENELQAQSDAPVVAPVLEPALTPAPTTEPTPTVETAPVQQLSRRERRRLSQEAARADHLAERFATDDMFRTPQPKGRAGNPLLVQLGKDWIDKFNVSCTEAAHNVTERTLATNGLYSVFQSFDRLNKDDTHELLDYLCDTIKSSNTGAYTRRIIFANLKFLPASKHELMARMLQLVTIAASDEDRSKTRKHTDPLYAINLYTNGETRSNIDSYFE